MGTLWREFLAYLNQDDIVKDQLLPLSEFLTSQGELHWLIVYS